MKYILLICVTLLSYTHSFAQEKNQQAEIQVKGITCNNDVNIISKHVEALPGVTSCSPKGKVGASSTLVVQFNPEETSIERIYATIEDSPSCDHPDQKPYKVKKPKSRK
jgi:copper chaperone CopZ